MHDRAKRTDSLRAVMRNALASPPTVLIVDPAGRIREAVVARGVNHPLLDRDGNIRPELQARGFVELEALYALEGPTGGFAVYLDFVAAKLIGKEATLPDAWLPPTVLKCRKEAERAAVWEAPPAPSSTPVATRSRGRQTANA